MDKGKGIKRVGKGFVVPNSWEPGKRFEWLPRAINQRGYEIGAEIGCAGGKTTGEILRKCPNVYLFAVDLWGPVPENMGGGSQYKKWNFIKIRSKFEENIKGSRNRVHILQGISWEMAGIVLDNSLDFIFIDADHEYESVIKDIKAWTPKLKPGGMISGHDTHFEGVMKAITELIPAYKAVGIDHCWEAIKEDVLF